MTCLCHQLGLVDVRCHSKYVSFTLHYAKQLVSFAQYLPFLFQVRCSYRKKCSWIFLAPSYQPFLLRSVAPFLYAAMCVEGEDT